MMHEAINGTPSRSHTAVVNGLDALLPIAHQMMKILSKRM
jgi:hypothetical protein